MADKKQETIADVVRKIRNEIAELRRVSPNVRSIAADWWEARADEIDAAHKLEAQSIERIVRDAIIDYTEQYPHAPNDDVESELKARANTANEWLKQHGFPEEPTNWSKEEIPCL